MIGKAMGKWHVPMESNRNHQENYRTIIGKLQEHIFPWAFHRKTTGKLWKIIGKPIEKQQIYGKRNYILQENYGNLWKTNYEKLWKHTENYRKFGKTMETHGQLQAIGQITETFGKLQEQLWKPMENDEKNTAFTNENCLSIIYK